MENQDLMTHFEGNRIRSVEQGGDTWFSVVDIIAALTNAAQPRTYWAQMKKADVQLLQVLKQLKLPSTDGKFYKTDCANTEGVLRLIQSVPSPQAEPFKLWLAQVGRERIEELNDPSLAVEHLKELYRLKGYTEEWIESRLKSIGIRKQLTDEWQKRGVKEGQEYAQLTAEIARQTFGLSPSEHAQLKQLDKQNLRDHMTNLELIFTMLGEETTRQVAIRDDSQGYNDNLEAAQKGGGMAGRARKNYEMDNLPVVSAQNFLKQIEEATQKKLLDTDDAVE
jgi:DNA-damage-inducible protein D